MKFFKHFFKSRVRGILSGQIIDNEKIPTDVTKEGWIFDPEEGKRIQGKYIFGQEVSVSKEELKFSLDESQLQTTQSEKMVIDESIVVVTIITIIAIGAALFYLKGYKK